MSEIRFSSHPALSSYATPGPRGFGPNPGNVGPGCSAPNPFLSRGNVATLMNPGSVASSNIFNAAPLLGTQSHFASQITNPSTAGSHSEQGLDGWTTFKGGSTANAVAKALTRATSRLGEGTRNIGSVAGLAGAAIALPGSISDAISSIDKARQTGERGDIARASANTTSAGSMGTRLVKHSLETVSIGSRFVVRRAGEKAFRQAAPGASKAVAKAAARAAADGAIKETGRKLIRRGATAAATGAAKSGSTLAKGAGTVGRAAAKKVLREGGEAAAKAAGKAVARGALKSGAKAAGRFVPGLNVAIAGLDTATAVATLADPKASTGKKVTSCITAAGSIVAATNIPVVSQVGAAVSTVSSFIGSFF